MSSAGSKKNFRDYLFVRFLIVKLNAIHLPGFKGMGLYDVLAFFGHALLEQKVFMFATAVAYSFFLALFPALIFFFTLIPYIPVKNLDVQILNYLFSVLPTQSYSLVKDTVYDIVHNRNVSLLSFGFLFTLFLATNGMNTLLSSFTRDYEILKRRSYIRQRVYALALTLVLAVEIIGGMILLVSGESLIKMLFGYLEFREKLLYYTLIGVNWIFVVAIIFFGISLLYYFGIPVKNRKEWKFITPGSILGCIFIILSTVGFKFYVIHFANYNKVYGSLGTMIILMVWFYLMSAILIIGFELNTAIERALHHHREKEKLKPKENFFINKE